MEKNIMAVRRIRLRLFLIRCGPVKSGCGNGEAIDKTPRRAIVACWKKKDLQ